MNMIEELLKVFDADDNKKEISLVNEVLPVIKNNFLYQEMNVKNLCLMNNVVQDVLALCATRRVMFYAVPVFAISEDYSKVQFVDVVYKKHFY